MPNKHANILILIYILTTYSLPVSAEDWRDDFNIENPQAWNIVGNDSIWKVTDGFLRVEVKREWEVEYELYQFTALPSPYRNFVVTINDFGGDKTRFGFVSDGTSQTHPKRIHSSMCSFPMRLERDVLTAREAIILSEFGYPENPVSAGKQTS